MSDEDKEEEEKQKAKLQDDKDFVPNPKELDGVPDLSMLVYLEMRHVLHNLHYRFKCMPRKNVYTSVSTILVAINPYERLPMYGQDVIDEFHEASKQGKLPQGRPHPYGVSARSYMRMVQRKCNQSVIVCGESGAGKTETTKLLMRYLAMTAPSTSMESSIVEQQIIAASPILEAYGNAKTVMNNNSSRFGKFTKLLYNVPDKAKEGHILGSYLETYLLEKSRVVFQANNERNYHIFYFLHKGLSPEQMKSLHLTSSKDFWYTKQGNADEIPGVNDKERYDELAESMKLMRIDSEMMGLWAITAGILNMGNIEFKKEGDGFASIKNVDVVKKVADLWGIADKALAERLTTSTMVVMKKNITKKVNFDEAQTNRDSISKGFFEQSFLYLCERINAELFQMSETENEEEEPNIESHLFIGILDVFGFENFYINSLEQFCINFTNEKLQQFFNYHIIRSEQEEYIKESVFWTPLNIPDNTEYIDMVEDTTKGFFTLLDSACKAPQPSVEAWMQEFMKTHGKNSTVHTATQPGSGNARGAPKKTKKKGGPKEKFTGFMLKHFADDVTYDSTNFLVKNNEAVHPDTAKMLAKSTNPLVQHVSQIGVGEKKKQGKLSVTGVFNKGIKTLMKNLKQTEPFFVRCVNPNGIKSATEWQEWVVEGQLRCGGLVEALKVLALGYPTRVPYNTLYEKYHSSVTNPMIRNMGPESFSTALLIAFDVSEDDYELGLTKIFFKPAKAAVLETIMAQAGRPLTSEQNVKITKWVVQKRLKQLVGMSKAFLELRHRVRLTRAAKRWEHVGRISSMLAFSLCRHLRMAREQILERKRNQSAQAIQSFFRGAYESSRYRKHVVKVKKATKMIWISYRRWNERKLLKSWLETKVIETRKRKEEERIRMEAARKKELEENARKAEEERLREQARKEAEERMEKERQRLLAEERAREEARKLEEQKRQEEEERKRKELDQEKELARQRIDRASTNVTKQKEEGERRKAAEARAERESSIKIKKKNLQKEERKRKQKREDDYIRTNFPEMVGDEDEEEEEEEDDEDDEKPKKKKNKKPQKAKKTKKGAKKKAKPKQPEDDGEDQGPGETNEDKEKDDASQESEEAEAEEDEVEEDEDDDASERDEEPVLSVAQQLKTFTKTAALGQLFLKYTGRRRRKPQDRIVKVTFGENASPKQISWGSGSRHIDFEEILYVAWGHWTPVFQARKDQIDPNLCFSVVGKTQTLDVQAQNKEMAELWVKGLRKLIGQTDEQALKLSKQGLEGEKNSGGDGTQPKKDKDNKDKGDTKEHKKRARSLMLLQQDLFVMTTTTVFRNLEEERIWDIDQSVRDKFNAKLLYEEALKEDVPWRQWNHWVREKVVAYLKENNRVTVQQPTYFSEQFTQPMSFTQPMPQVVYQPVQQIQPIQNTSIQPVYQQPVQRMGTQTFVPQSTMQPTINTQGGQQDEACTLM